MSDHTTYKTKQAYTLIHIKKALDMWLSSILDILKLVIKVHLSPPKQVVLLSKEIKLVTLLMDIAAPKLSYYLVGKSAVGRFHSQKIDHSLTEFIYYCIFVKGKILNIF